MILAGGMSSRLYPLTRDVPKPLIPLVGKPVVEHILSYLRSFGILDVAINVHYHAEKIRDRLGDGSDLGVRLHYLHERKLMGSAGAVKQMEHFFRNDNEPFIVIGCDDVTNVDLGVLRQTHESKDALATIALYEATQVHAFGVVLIDDTGRIRDFQEKPPKGTERSHLVNTGIYCFDPAIFERIAAHEFVDWGKDVFPVLQRQGAAFYGSLEPGAYWKDIGTLDEYRRATEDILEDRFRLDGVRRSNIPADAYIGKEVVIRGNVVIGDEVRIGDFAQIVGPAVIGNGARLGHGVTIERSILWDDVAVGDGAIVSASVLGTCSRIAPGATVTDEVVANGELLAG
ncbi:MAG TPA: NDP-sugar synthase [Candidatus Baltobacteraceae bacterium]